MLFGTRLPARDYEMMMFAWVHGGDPAGWLGVYGCEGTQNHKAYCSETVTDLLSQSNRELDPDRRASLVSRADLALARDVPTIPLYQFPSILAYRTVIHAVVDNISFIDGIAWNVEDWTKD